jgi:pyruvate dehydrogenase E2 component (dihydrolipoamide acetyltransferase)
MADQILPITMPKWGIEMTQGTINAWTAQEGQDLKRGDAVLEVETDKIVNTVESPANGRLRRILVPQGEIRQVGELIAVLAAATVPDAEIDAFIGSFVATNVLPTVTSAAATASAVAAAPVSAPAPASVAVATAPRPVASVAPSGPVDGRVSPATRRLAQELGVDLAQVRGTGRNGRVTAEDVEARAQALAAAGGGDNPATRTKLSATRATIARRLSESKQTIPHYRLAIDVDASALVARRRALADGGAKVTLNDLLLRAAARALVKHPTVNARLEGDEVLTHAHADIAVAVATPDGLITPVVRRADSKSLVEIAAETVTLAERARAGKLTREDIAGGTFTISNLGMYGLERFDAVINPPQVAILAIGAVADRVVAKAGKPVVAPVVSLTLSADHRVVDGAIGAAFLATLRDEIVNAAAL